MVVSKVFAQTKKPYPCHICGVIRHKLIDCSNFNGMQNMFKDEGVKSTKKKLNYWCTKVTTSLMNMVDVNVATT